ncbi:MAG TPA: NPCBM/NEW2 domain-containing protein, partial [Pirellulales bacterium]|nr:NPCBM/NEW2 domain-containing protein [Pirellulales bacterium]
RLAADENDPEANLAAGKFYCFVKQQWDQGLAYLARGSDPALKALAERDLAKPGSAEDQKSLAEDWWEFATTEKGPARAAIVNRAAFWYRRTLPFLSGLEKETVEKRLGELDAGAPAAGTETKYLADLPETNALVDRNLFSKGRTGNREELKVDGKLSPKGLFVPPASKGFSSVTYLVGRKARTFSADVGLAEWPSPSRTPLTFELWGDGALLWRSKQISGKQDTDHCEAFIGKVQTLELRVLCPGPNAGAKAVWVEPRVTLK